MRSAKVEQLSEEDLRLVGACLGAAVIGPYFPDWEFQTLMAADRTEVASVLGAWPEAIATTDWEPDAERLQEIVVNNVLAHLLWYPHGQWDELNRVLGVDDAALHAFLRRFNGGVLGSYFETLL